MQAAPLSPLAQLLWYKLIQLENRERWPEYVTVPNQDLTTLINVSQRNTVAKARTELVDVTKIVMAALGLSAGSEPSPDKDILDEAKN